jgi:polyisoprenoid-binding protein YceI
VTDTVATAAQLQLRTWAGTTVPSPGTFVLDAAHTTVGFVARHLMVTKVRGRFEQVEGSIEIGQDPLSSAATATIATASITTGSPDRDGHLRSGDFLAIDEHPAITFASTSVRHVGGNEFVVTGNLTIKGVTRVVDLDVEFDGVTRDPWGGERIAVTATTEIDREDFGITWNVALESGGVLVSRKVRLEIEAQAVRQA